eukprot:1910246-Alexandrium_andersonii.AAC.1
MRRPRARPSASSGSRWPLERQAARPPSSGGWTSFELGTSRGSLPPRRLTSRCEAWRCAPRTCATLR